MVQEIPEDLRRERAKLASQAQYHNWANFLYRVEPHKRILISNGSNCSHAKRFKSLRDSIGSSRHTCKNRTVDCGLRYKRRTQVRPLPRRIAISDLLSPWANNRRTSFSFFAAVCGHPISLYLQAQATASLVFKLWL